MGGWIKIYYQMLDWQWYSNTNVMRVFLHCLLKANYQPKAWQGITIERGQFVTSVATLSNELDMSGMQIRTALTKLQGTKEITIKTTNKYSIITICNYDNYQVIDNDEYQAEQQTNNKQITNKQQTNNNNIKNKEYKDIKKEELKNTTPNGDSTKKTKRQKKILPIPTIEEVAEYIKTKGYNLDARAFWSHYDARDWMRHGKVIENWHAQIATWVKNQPLYDNRPQPQGATFDEAERARLLAAIEQDKAKARVVQQQRDREQWEREERERIARLNELTGYDYQPENYDYYERRDD